ncbi:MAG: TonB-dependent receptor plug domain-containing protein [Phycisphaerae bacterium]
MYTQKRTSWFLFLLMSGLICGLSVKASAIEKDPNNKENYFEMSLEELMNTEISGSGSLTKTTRRKVPATMTTITRDDIQRTGARSLDELLLITVPGLQKQFHRNEYEDIGIRGIMSDRDDKYLLLVNGRLMNERFFYGAMAERDLPMLKDINHIDVIRGPGSALYGPGAIAMVINIITDNGLTFEGLETTARLGSIEEYYSSELKYGHRISDDEGVFLYGGFSHYPGASGDDAQRVYTYEGDTRESSEKRYGSAGFGNRSTDNWPKVKVHAQYNLGGLETWIRYTQGGHYRYTPGVPNPDHPAEFLSDADAYRKLTGYIGNRFEIGPTLALTPSFSFDIHEDYDLYNMANAYSWRRDEFDIKLMLDWTPNDNHQVTVGGEWSHAVNNLPGGWDTLPDWARLKDHSTYNNLGGDPFCTDLKSFMGEYQWRMSEAWTMFLGGRIDWNNYLHNMMPSPRAALVWTPTEEDTIKLMYTRSCRSNYDETLRAGYLANQAIGKPDLADFETIDSYELRYERQQTQKLWLAGSVFYNIQEPMGWGGRSQEEIDTGIGNGSQKPLGRMRSIGAELEATYRTDRMRITFSHAYTKLLSYSPASNVEWTGLTAAGQGYGMNFANFDNHCTKLRAEYDVTDRLSVDGSIQVDWGCPGKKDFVAWRRSLGHYLNPGDPGYARWINDQHIYNGGAFLNLGAQYKASKNLLVRFDAYNILGFFKKDFNAVKSFSDRWSNEEYNIVSPAFGVSVTYTF